MRGLSRCYLFSLILVGLCLNLALPRISMALEPGDTGDEGRFTAGFRLGPSFTTQDGGVSTAGPALNFQGLYGLNQWLRVGMMLEWERHGLDGRDGSVNTVSILPATLEFRPGRWGSFVPYLTTGIGVNVNTKDIDNTFAWRLGGGVDYALSNVMSNAPRGLMLNVETAWKRNQPGAELSTMGLLFGVRHTF
jgi:Outer membrane protein beta-barrel domain